MSDTDFWILPGGLDDQARAFDEGAQIMGDAKAWADDHPVGSADGHPLYTGAADAAREISGGLSTFFSHVQLVLTGVATELRDVAEEARGIDMQTAAELDAYDPAEYNDFDPEAPGRRSAAEIAPTYDRTEDEDLFPVYSLNAGGIGYYCDAGGQFDSINEQSANLVPGDILSPSEWAWTVMGWLGAQTLKEDLLEMFGGRWVDLYKFQYMLDGMGTLLGDLAGNLESSAGAISVYWQGYAANSAQEYLADLIERLRSAGRELKTGAGNFSDFLEGVDLEFEALSGAAYGFVDALIVAVVAFSAGAATVETGVGPVAGGAVGGISLLWAAKRLKDVWDGLQTAMTVLTTLDAVAHLSSDLSDVTAELHIPTMAETA